MASQNIIHAQYRDADNYDWEHRNYLHDLPFLEQLCAEHAGGTDGKVLDLCCGTGRETIPLARIAAKKNFRITGVDMTEAMLVRLREKLTVEPKEVQQAVDVVHGDMQTVDAGKGKYTLALIPFSGFLFMLTTEDQLLTLRNIHDHLAPGGYFLADIFCPNIEKVSQDIGITRVREELSVEDEERGELLVRSSTVRYDPISQIQRIRFYYHIYELNDERKLIRSHWSPSALRLIFPNEWRLLLQTAGFEIVEEWGNYDRHPFEEIAKKTPSPKMLFLCRKT